MADFRPKIKTSSPSGVDYFCNDLVLFTISGFLPGEYLLRVFPLICKSMKSRRLFLSLGLQSPTFSSDVDWYEFEGRLLFSGHSNGALDGRIVQRIADRGHVFAALNFFDSRATENRSFPCLEKLLSPIGCTISCDQFPKLTKLEINFHFNFPTTLLNEIWDLPLIELTLRNIGYMDPMFDYPNPPDGQPAFAQTLRSLESDDQKLLSMFLPYCRNIHKICIQGYHAIVAANPGLTSLTLTYSPSDHPVIDLTRHTQLVELNLCGPCPFFSNATHSQLMHLSLTRPDHSSAITFLSHSPALTHLSLNCRWEDVVKITAVLDPAMCKTLNIEPISPFSMLGEPQTVPSVEEVKTMIVDRGFQINGRFLLWTKDVAKEWRQVMNIAPHIKDWTLLIGDGLKELFFSPQQCRPFLTSFNTLSAITIDDGSWTHEILSAVVQSCPVLKMLTLTGCFSGELKLHSLSLRKINFMFRGDYSCFDLYLPSVTHLSLEGMKGTEILLYRLLNGEPKIQLPMLSVLSIGNYMYDRDAKNQDITVPCRVGHRSLSFLSVGHRCTYPISSLELAKLPCLKSLHLYQLLPPASILLDIPGDCEVRITSSCTTFTYSRELKKEDRYWVYPDFCKQVFYDEDENRWIERQRKIPKERKQNERAAQGKEEKKESGSGEMEKKQNEIKEEGKEEKKKEKKRKGRKRKDKRKRMEEKSYSLREQTSDPDER